MKGIMRVGQDIFNNKILDKIFELVYKEKRILKNIIFSLVNESVF